MAAYSIYQCPNPDCRMRLPVESKRTLPVVCPMCKTAMERVLVEYPSPRVESSRPQEEGVEIHVLLDNLRSAFNVGAVFRTADGIGVKHIHLCGISPTPENPKVGKTALSAQFATAWTYHRNGVEAAQALRASGMRLWALEGGERSRPLVELLPLTGAAPVVLAAGNELAGIDPGIMALCDEVVYLPMQGFKRSLNVAVAASIALYLLRYG